MGADPRTNSAFYCQYLVFKYSNNVFVPFSFTKTFSSSSGDSPVNLLLVLFVLQNMSKTTSYTGVSGSAGLLRFALDRSAKHQSFIVSLINNFMLFIFLSCHIFYFLSRGYINIQHIFVLFL